MRRRTEPSDGAATGVDPALADTREAGEPRADATLGDGLRDAFNATTITIPAAMTRPSPEREVRVSIAPPTDEEGKPRYEDGPLLGVGGMGEVRLHIDRRIGRPVALKTLRPAHDSEAAVARFLREARVQGQLEHPSIVPVYDLATDERGRPYFTMKRVRGQTLARILERLAAGDAEVAARFSRHKLLYAFVQVCLAVEYAHERGVLHRDLKPSNVMLGDFGEVYVLDWGIAKPTADGAPSNRSPATPGSPGPMEAMTRAGAVMGTPLYMAPEQLRADHDALGVPADVFALGAILFEILTLTPYRTVEMLEQLARREQVDRVERPSERAADVPPELDELCARALAPDPSARVASALAIAEAVERHLDGNRDKAARRALAAELLASAKARLAPGGDPLVSARVEAMRDALKALALSPDDSEVQRLLLSLVVDGSGALPDDAEREFAEGDVEVRRQGTRLGIYGYFSWLLALPLVMWAGIRDWTIPALQVGLTVLCILFAFHLLRRKVRTTLPAVLLAVLSGSVVALSSAWLGPFVLPPVAACATAVMFMVHSGREERRWLIPVWTVITLAPYAVEVLGLAPPAYTFRAGELVLHARAVELPPGPTIAALAYTSVSFLGLLCVFVGRLREQQRAAERRLFVQAWHLRQLFPAGAAPRG